MTVIEIEQVHAASGGGVALHYPASSEPLELQELAPGEALRRSAAGSMVDVANPQSDAERLRWIKENTAPIDTTQYVD